MQLDRVERRIRIAKHIERRFAICPVGRIDGIPHRDGVVIDRLLIVELLLEADEVTHDALGSRQVIGRQHDDELITAVAGQDGLAREEDAHEDGEMAQGFIADLMAVDIIDELEIINVELHEEGLLQPSAIELRLDDGFEAVAVEKPRELVGHGQTPQVLLLVVHEEQDVGQCRQHEQGHEAKSSSCTKRAHHFPALARCKLHAPLAAAIRESIADRVDRRDVRLQDGRIVVIAEARLLKAVCQARLVHVGDRLREDVGDLDVDRRKAPELLRAARPDIQEDRHHHRQCHTVRLRIRRSKYDELMVLLCILQGELALRRGKCINPQCALLGRRVDGADYAARQQLNTVDWQLAALDEVVRDAVKVPHHAAFAVGNAHGQPIDDGFALREVLLELISKHDGIETAVIAQRRHALVVEILQHDAPAHEPNQEDTGRDDDVLGTWPARIRLHPFPSLPHYPCHSCYSCIDTTRTDCFPSGQSVLFPLSSFLFLPSHHHGCGVIGVTTPKV